MPVKITPEAEEYIRQKGGAAVIILGSMGGCCGSLAPLPNIHLSSPNDLALYNLQNIGDIKLFVDNRIDPNKHIHVSLTKLWRFKKLSVEIV